MTKYRSWAYIPEVDQKAVIPAWSDFDLDLETKSLLPHGNARSYSDSCLNSEGTLIENRLLDRFISFDEETGILKCESGVLFSQILDLIVPKNWFLPVTPGTKYVTVGGAIANDVHGKNHHQDGSLGRHIRSFELKRSDGTQLLCTANKNPDYFSATIGGLGLTGFITWAEIQLLKIPSPMIKVETTAFYGLDEFYSLSEKANTKHQYSVAWLDCNSKGSQFARGLFMAGDHTESTKLIKSATLEPKLSIPFNFPQKTLNQFTIKAFNTLYFNKNRLSSGKTTYQHYDSFFYPLDGIGNWNRIYGNKGFYQYQFVVPFSEKETMKKILEKIVDSGLGSFLAVLKEFGDLSSPGMLSFPRPGICLALDFANRGDVTLKLIAELDDMVVEAGGAAYPAKDVCMSSKSFQSFYPKIEEFKKYIDPRFSSDFWRRVSENLI
jgi:FAD/FMN-containing dehydrogenase